MKRNVFTIIVLILVYAVTTVAGAETANADGLTLTEAQQLAEKNSRQAVIDDLDIKAKESAYQRAVDDAALAGNPLGPESIYEKRIRQNVKPMEAETALELAKMTKSNNIRQLKYDVKKLFLNILLTQKELEITTKKLEYSKFRLEIAETKYSTNIITEQELISAQNDVFKKEIDVEAIKENLKILDSRLKNLMGLPLEGDVLILKGEIKKESLPEIDIEKAVSNDNESDINVYSATRKYYAAKRSLELIEDLLKPGNETYDSYNIELEIAFRDYEAAKRNREINIRNIYNELLNLKDNVELAEKYEELQMKMLDSIKTKYEKGQISKEIYINYEEQYLDSMLNKYKAICDFNLKKDEFFNMVQAN